MPEIQNSSNINEINDSMNFETELFKSKSEKKTGKQKLVGLFRSFSHLKLKTPKQLTLLKKSDKKNNNKKNKILFEAERIMKWDEITRKDYKDFHKLDKISKYKLSKIIPTEISRKRFQELIVPTENSPNGLKRIFMYLAYSFKTDLIAECTTEPTNYRPLTFPPEFINKKPVGESNKIKRHPVDLNDWHAANLMIFQNLANLLYGVSLEFCNTECCPRMTIGKDYEYLWCDGVTFVKPISVPARTYMKFCLLWIQKQLKDPNVITSTVNALYPADSLSTWKMVYRRLLRVYAHLCMNHQEDFDKCGAIGSVLHCMFRRFILYGIESGLTNNKELLPVKNIKKKIQREFRLNKAKE